MNKKCTRCLYDERIPDITFDSNGACSYCKIHDEMDKEYPTGAAGWEELKKLAVKIKRSGRNKKYDCVIGVSGGCDSSYLCYLAKEKLGLRPLAAHFDNTWNSKIAVNNIYTVLKKLDIDLYTYVMDNEEFNDMAKSFLNASVPEIDALTDIALATTLYMAADEHKIKYILQGHSFRTEGIVPLGWFYFDGKYISDIHKKFGTMKMDRYPNLWLGKWLWWLMKGIKRVRPLYYIDYHKENTKKFLAEKFGWEWYGGHHMENRYTTFENIYLHPKKFNIDFRYVEFSALVRSGQMKKEDALKKLEKLPDCPENVVEEVKKRLGLDEKEFERIMNLPPKTAKDYKTYHPTFKRLKYLFWLLYKMDRVPKSFYVKYTK